MSSTVIAAAEYRNLPIAWLQESPTNPRRRFDEHSLNELAACFKTQGILQPLLVREIATDQYEVIAGARRLRAAKLAELTEVPVRVAELSDADCVLAQLVENIQREGVHPMEEALAFDALLRLEEPRYDVASVAQKAGKSPAFVAQRLRLVELVPPVAEAFLEDKIGVGHALEIAKLPQSEQQQAFEACFRPVWNGGKQSPMLLPVREVTAWIEQNILLVLDSVAFDKNDATLLAEAGSCTECPKRTGYNTLLFGDATADSCTDRACYSRKLAAHIERQIAAKPQLVQIATSYANGGNPSVLGRNRYVALQLGARNGKSKTPPSPHQKPCKQMTEAIVVDGPECGHIVKVCADPACPVHFADRHSPSPEQMAKEREQRRKELEKQKLQVTIRHRTLAEVLKKVGSPLEKAGLALVAATLVAKLEPLRCEALARRHKLVEGKPSEVTYPQVQKAIAGLLRRADESALAKLLVELVLLETLDQVPSAASSREDDVLTATAKRYGVDVEKLSKAVEKEFTAKHAKQKDRQDKKNRSKKNTARKEPTTAA